jgi:hypothetical protein
VQESAGKIVAMGNGNDENPVARWTQWLIRRLLR